MKVYCPAGGVELYLTPALGYLNRGVWGALCKDIHSAVT